jgi:hypothetical protein
MKWVRLPDHPESLTLQFQYGTIVWSPNQGTGMSVAVWQSIHRGSDGTPDGTYSTWIDAGDTYPFTYDKFLLRLNGVQSELSSNDGSKISGLSTFQLTSGLGAATVYSPGDILNVSMEGCDGHVLASSTCHQGWTVPINWQFVAMTPLVTPDGVIAATTDPRYLSYTFRLRGPAATASPPDDTQLQERGRSAAAFIGCGKTLGTIFQDEQDFGTGVLAKLEMSSAGSYACNSYHPLSIPALRERPWLAVDEVNAALRFQRVQSDSGTSSGSPCTRTGEYDVVLPRLIAALMGFGTALDSDVRDYILNGLLNIRGPLDPSDLGWDCDGVTIPETENHLNNMESSRYLTNQLLYAKSGDPLFDNETNGMNDYWLARLKQFLQTDFLEYNSKTYQTYSDLSLQNLADYANDRRVQTAARAVLDYIAAKYAISSIGLRRNAPFRRHPGDYNNVPTSAAFPNILGEHDLLGLNAETQNGRFALYTGLYSVHAQVPVTGGGFNFHQSYASDMVLAYASQYRPPTSILNFLYDQNAPATGTFGSVNFERIHHAGFEIYSGRPQYLISAGGIWTDTPYQVAGLGNSSDQGAAVITSLIPGGSGLMSDDLIRFTGLHDEDGLDAEHEIGEPSKTNPQTCVGPDFACGYNVVIPSAIYLSNSACVVYKAEMCGAASASTPEAWTFLNRSDDALHCVAGAPAGGFFVAIHQDNSASNRAGSLEAFPANAGKSFSQFVAGVCSRNGAHALVSQNNSYTTTAGVALNFSLPLPPNPLFHQDGQVSFSGTTFGTSNAPMDSWPLASGTILNADGQGKVTFHEPASALTLTLDLTDASEPVWSEK